MNREQELRADVDRLNQEMAWLADSVAFWAFQAKWYCAQAHNLGAYDDLPLETQKAVDAILEKNRVAENKDRLGRIEPAWDIGT